MIVQWDDIAYLKTGTKRQQEAYHTLLALNIFEILREYTPILVGTIPLDVDISNSDLDIICEVADLDTFENYLQKMFGMQTDFFSHRKTVNKLPVLIAKFKFQKFLIEIFGQPRPVKQQNAYRHMVAEGRLLALAGEEAKQAIRYLKTKGIKTEPAFGEYFALSGNPFETLYQLADVPDAFLQNLIMEQS